MARLTYPFLIGDISSPVDQSGPGSERNSGRTPLPDFHTPLTTLDPPNVWPSEVESPMGFHP